MANSEPNLGPSAKTANSMRELIKHVVVIMLENRGFDTALGYLYQPDEQIFNIPPLAPGESKFDGLSFVDTKRLTNRLVRDGKLYCAQPPVPGVRATNTPGYDPHEEYEYVNQQLFGTKHPLPNQTPDMLGFLQDYGSLWSKFDINTPETISQLMHMYTPADLPVISALAKGYATSDRWFSSVPTQTNANRAFSLAGTSMGLVDNGFLSTNPVSEKLADDRFNTATIWQVLENNNFHDWGIFWHDTYPPIISNVPYTRRIFPTLEKITNIDTHFHKMDQFFELAGQGSLPAFSYIEPSWGGEVFNTLSIMGNEYHPPSDTTPGEELLKRIYISLRQNVALWEKTLLVIMFDEHGGTYDHVPPPWGAVAPWGSNQPPFPLQHGFKFDRFGVRVPAILVSPYIEQGTVFRSTTNVPYDHTSMLATVLTWAGIDRNSWGLGERVLKAPTFDNVLTRTLPRTDNIFGPKTPPPIGTVLKFGDQFCLKHMSGKYVIQASSGLRYYFPRLGDDPIGAARLDFRFGWGEVQNGAIVQLRTAEFLVPYAKQFSFAGIRNFLGAWKDEHDCYYYSSDDTQNYGQQYWKVSRINGVTGPIKYGDQVYIESQFPDFFGQRLMADGEWLTTGNGVTDCWMIVPVPK